MSEPKRIRDKWKELEMKLKIAVSAIALFSSLGVGGSIDFAWGFLEQLQQNDMRHDKNIQVLTSETILLKYDAKKERLKASVKEYKKELFDLRREYGGPERDEELPLGDYRIKAWYLDIVDSLNQAKEDLSNLEKEIEKFQDPLKVIRKDGGEK